MMLMTGTLAGAALLAQATDALAFARVAPERIADEVGPLAGLYLAQGPLAVLAVKALGAALVVWVAWRTDHRCVLWLALIAGLVGAASAL